MEKPDTDTPAAETVKTRRCLKCRTEFDSVWKGHRICNRCKGTSAWREGMHTHSHGMHGH